MSKERCPVHDRIVKATQEDNYNQHGHVDCPSCKTEKKPGWVALAKSKTAEAQAEAAATEAAEKASEVAGENA
jgi:hypothetical protein